MSQQVINVGTVPNDGLGDPLRTAFIKTNNNFSQLFSIPQTNPPPTLTGTIGDFAGMYAYDSTYFYYCFANYTGNSTIWGQVTQAGNVSVTAINNGNSNVKIVGTGANATVSIGGTSNIAVFATTGVYLSGVVSASGNVTGGNILTGGLISATGNITGDYILGNGSQLTGLPATYGNSNVTSLLAALGSNTISTTGNITSGYLFGNASQLTGLPQSYSNSNVSSFLSAFGSNTISTTGTITAGNISGGNLLTTGLVSSQGNIQAQGQISALGNIVTSGYIIGDIIGNITATIANLPGPTGAVVYNNGSGNAAAVAGFVFDPTGPNTLTVLGTISSQGNVIGGNITTVGQVTATGNITGNYILGNGSQLTGLPQSYSNSNVSSFLSAFGSNTISTTGTITAGNITGANVLTGGIMSSTGNATHGNILTSGLVSATSNVTGGNIRTGGQVSATANVIGGNVLTGGQVSAAGNVTGNYINVTNDINIGGNATAAGFAGSTVSASGNIVGGNIVTGGRVSATGNITGNYILGNGSQLTGLAATYSNSNVTSLLAEFGSNTISTSGNIISGNVSATGNVTSGNIIATGNLYYNSTTLVTRSLTVGTRSTPVTIALTANGSFNVLTRDSGNVAVTTST